MLFRSIIGTNESYLGYNLYAYCDNNPINNTDPEGNFAGTLALGLGLGGIALGTAAKAFLGIVAKQAIAVTCAVVTASVVKSISNTKSQSSTKKQQENHTVYVLKEPITGKVEYVGRTTNITVREKQHKNDPNKNHLKMTPILENVSYSLARGTEQGLIEYYQTLNRGNYSNNQIRGISPFNPNRRKYMQDSYDFFGEEIYVGGIQW